MLSTITTQFKRIFTSSSDVRKSCKRPLEEESEDEEREGEPVRKRRRPGGADPPFARSYKSRLGCVIVNSMSGIFGWMSTLVSPRRREPPEDVGDLAYGSHARIKIGGRSEDEGNVVVSPEEYVRGQVTPDTTHLPFSEQSHLTRSETHHAYARTTPNLPQNEEEVQFVETVKGGTPVKGRRGGEQPSRRPSLPRMPLQHPGPSLSPSPPAPSGINPSFRFAPTIDLTSESALARHRNREPSWFKSSQSVQKPLSLRRRSEIVSKNPMGSLHTKPAIQKRRSGNSLFSGRGNSCAQESFRFEDKMRYLQLLQQFTDSCIMPPSHGIYRGSSTPTFPSNSSTSSSGIITRFRLDETWTKQKKYELEGIPAVQSPLAQHPAARTPPIQYTRRKPTTPDASVNRHKALSSKKTIIPVIDIAQSESNSSVASSKDSERDSVEVVCEVPRSPTPSTLEKRLQETPYYHSDWLKDLAGKYAEKDHEAKHKVDSTQRLCRGLEERRKKDASLKDHITRSLKSLDLKHTSKYKVVELVEDEDEEEEELLELTPEMEEMIEDALVGSPQRQVLVYKFNIQITRRDISTLAGLNWLNDEVINFYLNLIMERGTTDNHKSVYAFNTFFYPKLVKSQYSAVKRWTKKVDLFSYDLLLVPVHLGMHWCLASVDFKTRAVRYYDSMLGDNDQCLETLLSYLESEHQDKKKSPYNTTGWKLEHMKDIPQQMNGSDCGMFSCKFSEYLSRGARFTFGQEDMPYFRRRMVYEIINGRLL